MYNDLFLALQEPHNPRGHPLLAALLYAFCPAAARWWLAGADPDPAFDPLWQALSDLAGGRTLKEALSGYGFETLLADARQYVEQVEAFRRLHPGVAAPELLPTFGGGHLELAKRFGLREAINRLGGRWENFFAYVRAWAFLVSDWEAEMRFFGTPDLACRQLMLTLPGIRRPLRFPAWVWFDRLGHAERVVIGLLVKGGEQDELRFALARLAGPEGDAPWPAPPEVWAMDRESGKAEPVDPHLPLEGAAPLVSRMAELAKQGPYPPLAAFSSPERCRSCGFSAQCFNNVELSPLALEF
ncbi:MAG: hypothetical protein P8074_23775 [Anaerolineales bacterium]